MSLYLERIVGACANYLERTVGGVLEGSLVLAGVETVKEWVDWCRPADPERNG